MNFDKDFWIRFENAKLVWKNKVNKLMKASYKSEIITKNDLNLIIK